MKTVSSMLTHGEWLQMDSVPGHRSALPPGTQSSGHTPALLHFQTRVTLQCSAIARGDWLDNLS